MTRLRSGKDRTPVPGLEAIDGRLLDGLNFCRIAYRLFEEMRSSSKGINELRRRKPARAKKLVEEVLPLAAFVKARYDLGRRLRVRWIGGSQRGDATLLCRGVIAERENIPRRQRLEITAAVQATEHLVRERLATVGGSFSAAGTRRDRSTGEIVSEPAPCTSAGLVTRLAGLVSQRIGAKLEKQYSADTLLLIACEFGTLIEDREWQAILESVSTSLPQDVIRFREIVLVHPDRCPATVFRHFGDAPGRGAEGSVGSAS